MRRVARLALFAFALALAGVASAEAKGPVPVEACGMSGCERTVLEMLPQKLALPPDYLFADESTSPPPATPGPWYEVRFEVPDNRGVVDDRCQVPPAEQRTFCDPNRRAVVLADGSFVGGDNSLTNGLTWHRLAPAEAAVYADLTDGLEPFAAATLPGVEQPPADTGAPWLWLAIGAGALLLVAALAGSRLRRGRSPSAPPSAASS